MTDTNNTDGLILKTDSRGRVRTSAKRRETLLEEFDRSGLSGKKFAEVTGLKYQTLATWLQKRRRAGQPSSQAGDTVRWLEAVVDRAQVSGGQNPTALVLMLPGGARVEISDAQQVSLTASLLRALAKPC